MKVSIQRIALEGNEFHLFFDQDQEPVINVSGQIYTVPSDLFQTFPFLSSIRYLGKAAQMINFLSVGLEFRFIENVEKFKDHYLQCIESELGSVDSDRPMLSQYGIFDVSHLHPPQIQDGSLVFYVKNDQTQLPYRVEVPFPPIEEEFEVQYELLPYAN